MIHKGEIYGLELESSSINKGDYEQVHYLERLSAFLPEVFILSTCQRFVVFSFCSAPGALSEAVSKVFGEVEIKARFATTRLSADYLFEISGGLKSRVFGEHEIVGQVRKQYDLAQKAGAIGVFLNEFVMHALQCGKRVRTETGIGKLQISYVSLALDRIREFNQDITKLNYLVIGSGQLAIQVLKHFTSRGIGRVDIASHNLSRAKEQAVYFGVSAVPINALHFEKYDVIVGCTHGEIDFTYHYSSSETCPRHNDVNLPPSTLIIDFGQPPNFPGLEAKIGGVNYYGIEQIMGRSQRSMAIRKKELPGAKIIVSSEVDKFLKRFNHRKVSPVLGGYWRKLDEIREEELQWVLPKINVTQEETALLERFALRLIRKISKDTFRSLREMSEDMESNASQVEALGQLLRPNDTNSKIYGEN